MKHIKISQKLTKFCFATDPVYKKPCHFRSFASSCTVHAFLFPDKSVSVHFLFKNIDANKPPEHSNHPLSMSSRLSPLLLANTDKLFFEMRISRTSDTTWQIGRLCPARHNADSRCVGCVAVFVDFVLEGS